MIGFCEPDTLISLYQCMDGCHRYAVEKCFYAAKEEKVIKS